MKWPSFAHTSTLLAFSNARQPALDRIVNRGCRVRLHKFRVILTATFRDNPGRAHMATLDEPIWP